jgi:hypothetical protein
MGHIGSHLDLTSPADGSCRGRVTAMRRLPKNGNTGLVGPFARAICGNIGSQNGQRLSHAARSLLES